MKFQFCIFLSYLYNEGNEYKERDFNHIEGLEENHEKPLVSRRCFLGYDALKIEQDGPPKRWFPSTTLHGVTIQKTST